MALLDLLLDRLQRRRVPPHVWKARASQVKERWGQEKLEAIRRTSMLDGNALAMLAGVAELSRGGILEIGTYIGGSTVALALGNCRRRRFAAIEIGGSNPDHPHLPCHDILGELKRNLHAFGVADAVRVVPGTSHQLSVRKAALAHTGSIGLLVVDADGQIALTVRRLAHAMWPDCLVVIDDYLAPGAPEKSSLIRPWVDDHVAAGRLIEFGVWGTGTWFGQLAGRKAREWMRTHEPLYMANEGYGFAAFIEAPCEPDAPETPQCSPLRLFEDGRELGPTHALHEDIRRLGTGRYSHWVRRVPEGYDPRLSFLLFSTSDNTDPNSNGRRYSVAVADRKIPLELL